MQSALGQLLCIQVFQGKRVFITTNLFKLGQLQLGQRCLLLPQSVRRLERDGSHHSNTKNLLHELVMPTRQIGSGCHTNAMRIEASSIPKLCVMENLVMILVTTKSTEVTAKNQPMTLGNDEKSSAFTTG